MIYLCDTRQSVRPTCARTLSPFPRAVSVTVDPARPPVLKCWVSGCTLTDAALHSAVAEVRPCCRGCGLSCTPSDTRNVATLWLAWCPTFLPVGWRVTDMPVDLALTQNGFGTFVPMCVRFYSFSPCYFSPIWVGSSDPMKLINLGEAHLEEKSHRSEK